MDNHVKRTNTYQNQVQNINGLDNDSKNFTILNNYVQPLSYPSPLQPTEENEKILKDKLFAEDYLQKCRARHIKALNYFKANKIKEGLAELVKEENYLLGLRKVITEKKKYLVSYLQGITTMINEIHSISDAYLKEKYKLISKYTKYTQQKIQKPNTPLPSIMSLIQNDFLINFVDVYTEYQNYENILYSFWLKTNITNHKTLLLYGPKGSGKTANVYAFAAMIHSPIFVIDNVEMFTVFQDFVYQIYNISKNIQPLIIYIKNIEKMSQAQSHIFYLIEKITEKKDNKILIIASCNCPPNYLPKPFFNKFVYMQYVPNAKNKGNFINFIGKKMNIPINLSTEESVNLSQSAYLYSNGELKDALEMASQLKNDLNDNDLIENNISYDTLMNYIKLITPNMNQEMYNGYLQKDFTNIKSNVEKPFMFA